MVDILHRVGVKTSGPENVYQALTTVEGLAGWWTDDTKGSGETDGVLEFRFSPGGFGVHAPLQYQVGHVPYESEVGGGNR